MQLLQKRSTGKTAESSKHLQHIAMEKDIFSEQMHFSNIFKVQKVIPKILFILVLCKFNFFL